MKKKYILKVGSRGNERAGLQRHSTFKPRYPSAVAEVLDDLKRRNENAGGIQYEFDYIGYRPLDHIA